MAIDLVREGSWLPKEEIVVVTAAICEEVLAFRTTVKTMLNWFANLCSAFILETIFPAFWEWWKFVLAPETGKVSSQLLIVVYIFKYHGKSADAGNDYWKFFRSQFNLMIRWQNQLNVSTFIVLK